MYAAQDRVEKVPLLGPVAQKADSFNIQWIRLQLLFVF